ncbi:hypothetical protein STENM223S_06005 [Streptomyces tendae]
MGLECGRFDVVEEAESVGTDGFVLVRARRSRSRARHTRTTRTESL